MTDLFLSIVNTFIEGGEGDDATGAHTTAQREQIKKHAEEKEAAAHGMGIS